MKVKKLKPSLELSVENVNHLWLGEASLDVSTYIYDDISDIAYHDHSGAAELTLITQGYGYHYLNEDILEVSAGEVFFLDTETFHSFYPVDRYNSTRLQVVNCTFSTELFYDCEDAFPELREALQFASKGSEEFPLRQHNNYLGRELSAFVEPLILHIRELHKEDKYKNMDAIRLAIGMILLEIYRKLPQKGLVDPSHEKNPIVLDAMQFIEQNYADPDFSLSMVYEHVYVSKSHLCTLFREETGTTPVRYLNRMRVKRACELLQKGADDLDKLYQAVGYREYNTFYINFRKYTGFSIRDYMKALRSIPVPLKEQKKETLAHLYLERAQEIEQETKREEQRKEACR